MNEPLVLGVSAQCGLLFRYEIYRSILALPKSLLSNSGLPLCPSTLLRVNLLITVLYQSVHSKLSTGQGSRTDNAFAKGIGGI